jgi:polysaccharide export outer membrane protein
MWTYLAPLIVVSSLMANALGAADQLRPLADGAIPTASAAGPTALAPPPDYVIGPGDRLAVVFWRDTEITSDVVVRPDGRISLPLLNDIDAAGLTPNQLRERVLAAAVRYIEDPDATVVVKEIHSRQVFITGNVDKPGSFPLNGRTTVLQLIATAGGLREFVSGKNIIIVRSGNTLLKFNYRDVVSGKALEQNIELRPGDTVIVP